MLFLTSEVEDTKRKREERDSAEEILKCFTPARVTLFALEADLAAHGTEFLRYFDVKSPDPALLPRRVRRFVSKTKLLFMGEDP